MSLAVRRDCQDAKRSSRDILHFRDVVNEITVEDTRRCVSNDGRSGVLRSEDAVAKSPDYSVFTT